MEAKRPTILVVAVVILIILGGLGVMAGCLGIASVAGQGAISQMNEQLLAGAPGGAEQLEAQREMMAIQSGFTVPQIIGQLFNLLGSVLLIVGAAMLASLKKSAQNLLLAATGICVLGDLVNAALGLYIGYASQGALERMTAANPQAEQVMGAMMNATMVISVIWAIVWLLIKIGIYGFGVYTSRKPEVAQVLA